MSTAQRYAATYCLRKKVRMAAATGIIVATILVIPDAMAILPNASSPAVFAIRLIGLWLSVLVQWFLCFLGILSLAGFVNRGIVVDEFGIKLSRFSKRIEWIRIRAISSDHKPLFSKLFGKDAAEYRVHIYVEGKRNKKGVAGLSTKQIDSFLFSSSEFKNLLDFISRKSFGMEPDSAAVMISSDGSINKQLKKAYRGLGRKQKLITAYAAIMLVAFLGRNCVRNFAFNEAANAFNRQDYVAAKQFCQTALSVDPTFPYAWDRLARAEFRMKNLANAEKDWNKALKMKPDLVSAKVGLSNICMQRRDYKTANKLLTSAIRLEEANVPALLNLTELNMLTAQYKRALYYADLALQLAPRDTKVRLVCAQTYSRIGSVNKAERLLQDVERDDELARATPLFKIVSENLRIARIGEP